MKDTFCDTFCKQIEAKRCKRTKCLTFLWTVASQLSQVRRDQLTSAHHVLRFCSH